MFAFSSSCGVWGCSMNETAKLYTALKCVMTTINDSYKACCAETALNKWYSVFQQAKGSRRGLRIVHTSLCVDTAKVCTYVEGYYLAMVAVAAALLGTFIVPGCLGFTASSYQSVRNQAQCHIEQENSTFPSSSSSRDPRYLCGQQWQNDH